MCSTEEMHSGAEREQELRDGFPSINDAYGFVLPAYDWAHRRFAELDRRLQQLSLMAASLTVGAPLVVRAVVSTESTGSPWLYAALALGPLS